VSTRTRVVLGVLVALTVIAGVGVTLALRNLEPRLRDWITKNLERSLESKVELDSVHLTWMPLRVHAEHLTVRHHGRTDIPPLLVVASFTVDLKPTELWSSTVEHVAVDGMEISFPPKDPETGKRPMPKPGGGSGDGNGFLVKRLTATNTRLAIIPRTAGKNAKVWDIFELDVRNLGDGQSSPFTAALINPIPYGKIESSGQFGPWTSTEPGDTPLSGKYTFAADLGTINGLGGQLKASGDMEGTIDQIVTHGETETPDFRLTELDGSPLPLRTKYDALVDGTSGDVKLRSVDIQLGKSALHARGLVEGTKGVKGKRVSLNVTSKDASLGELLRLASKKQPPVNGALVIDGAFDLPQGKAPVLERLELEGSVRADRLLFTNDVIQDKVDELSRRAQGKPGDTSIGDVASKVATKFVLHKGVFTYSGLSFSVQGAAIKLDGTHSLKSKIIDLQGVALLNATVSQTQTGFKSWMLKPFDGFFKKDGAGTRLVITVQGTQDQPKVGLDFGKTWRGQPPAKPASAARVPPAR
jgi:hypothetical protein